MVAEKTERDALELPPLYDTIDADLLDSIVESMDNGAISFTYADQDILITSDGEVSLTD